MKATRDDIPAIIDLMCEMHAESPNRPPCAPDLVYLHNSLSSLLDEPGIILRYIPGGVFMGYVGPNALYPIIEATEHLFYVSKAKRGSPTGYRLLKEYEQVALNAGASVVEVSENSGINSDKVDTFYSKMGYSKRGTNYKKEI